MIKMDEFFEGVVRGAKRAEEFFWVLAAGDSLGESDYGSERFSSLKVYLIGEFVEISNLEFEIVVFIV